MPRRYRPEEVVKVLESLGWAVVRQRGSNVILSKEGIRAISVVPLSRREVAPGTFGSILRQAELSPREFEQRANEVL